MIELDINNLKHIVQALRSLLPAGCDRVLIHGQEAPVVGRICIDQTIVDVDRY